MKPQLTKMMILVAILTLGIASCKKDDTSPTVSDDEAANAVGEMVASDFSGSAADAASLSTSDAAHAGSRIDVNGRSLASSCGVIVTKDTVRASKAGAVITYTWTGQYALTLACNGKIPTALNLTLTSSSQSTGLKVSSAGESTGSFALTGFEGSSSNYFINGTFDRTETITELSNSKSFTGTHQLTITNVLVDKTTYVLKGGTATYTMTGAFGSTAYTHSGTITFTGNGTATIVVNGNNYTVDLVTGTVTKM